MFFKKHSLKKARKTLEESYKWYKKKWRSLSPEKLASYETDLAACDVALLKKDEETASNVANKLKDFNAQNFKKSFPHYVLELFTALILALVVATVVRAMWFELYEIPTGSMRPTFKEQDHLTVSKAQFGINVPLQTSHFYFDPTLVERAGIVIWSGDGVALRDTDTTFLGIFPYKKRFVKRLIGKPGDTLYFYGGKIYGIDKEGKPIEELLKEPSMQKLEHIPFITFEGEISTPRDTKGKHTIQFEQMHQPIGRLVIGPKGTWEGEIFNGTAWVKDQPSNEKKNSIMAYGDFMGMNNFGMARLLAYDQLKNVKGIETDSLEKAPLYLEIAHHPSLTYPKPLMHQEHSSLSIAFQPEVSIIALQEQHLQAIMNNMYTARFEVHAGVAKRYSVGEGDYVTSNPKFAGIPDGTYEFYYGKAYRVGFGGITTLLPKDHPLYSLEPQNVQNLFNFGIDFSTFYAPRATNATLYPHRYAYFRDGDLYLLGGVFLHKDDPALKDFLAKEDTKEKQSTTLRPYIPFKDQGPPLKDGHFDAKFIKTYGLAIPAKNYLVLGDNHAMSADSRIFGTLPQENLQGVPDLLLWPPHSIGHPNQKPYPLFTTPRLIIWSLAALTLLLYLLYQHHRKKQPIFKKLS